MSGIRSAKKIYELTNSLRRESENFIFGDLKGHDFQGVNCEDVALRDAVINEIEYVLNRLKIKLPKAKLDDITRINVTEDRSVKYERQQYEAKV